MDDAAAKKLMSKSGALILCLNDALEKSLVALSRFHGGQSGAWLDAIEKSVIDDMKETVTEGFSIEDEADGVKFAMDTVADLFARVRTRLET